MSKENYKKQVDLLLNVIDLALKDDRMALKGGTAINLFHWDLKRFSVDIDLCYLPLEDRATTFKNIHSILKTITDNIESLGGYEVKPNVELDGKKEAKLFVTRNGIEIKIEPNYTLRGSLYETVYIKTGKKTEDVFQKSVKVKCLNLADCYGGKICAALDRQHPRDLYDIKTLFENTGLNVEIKNSFLTFLLSHGRPIHELLDPKIKDIKGVFQSSFDGMTEEIVSISELEEARKSLIKEINELLTLEDKEFLISFISNKPDWSKCWDAKIKDFPGVKWKLYNQEKMNYQKRNDYIKFVKSVLNF